DAARYSTQKPQSSQNHVGSGFPPSLRFGEARRSAERGGGSRILRNPPKGGRHVSLKLREFCVILVARENIPIERRGRKGRKVRMDFFAAFAAFAFHRRRRLVAHAPSQRPAAGVPRTCGL